MGTLLHQPPPPLSEATASVTLVGQADSALADRGSLCLEHSNPYVGPSPHSPDTWGVVHTAVVLQLAFLWLFYESVIVVCVCGLPIAAESLFASLGSVF